MSKIKINYDKIKHEFIYQDDYIKVMKLEKTFYALGNDKDNIECITATRVTRGRFAHVYKTPCVYKISVTNRFINKFNDYCEENYKGSFKPYDNKYLERGKSYDDSLYIFDGIRNMLKELLKQKLVDNLKNICLLRYQSDIEFNKVKDKNVWEDDEFSEGSSLVLFNLDDFKEVTTVSKKEKKEMELKAKEELFQNLFSDNVKALCEKNNLYLHGNGVFCDRNDMFKLLESLFKKHISETLLNQLDNMNLQYDFSLINFLEHKSSTIISNITIK